MRENTSLANLTSLSVGGPAERLYICTSSEQLYAALEDVHSEPLWVLGFGTNVLVSDAGLPGATVLMRTDRIVRESDTVIADAGAWWDDVVQFAIRGGLWG